MKKNVYAVLFCALFSTLPLLADTVQFAPPARDSSITRRGDAPEVEPSCGVSPFAFSIVPPAQFPADGFDIYGFRISIFVGSHRDVAFFDFGTLGSRVGGNLSGIQVSGLYNRIGESDGAIEIAGFINYCERDFAGLQISTFANNVLGDMQGLQISLANTAGDFSGLQLGVVNRIERGFGMQIGLVNYANQLEGLQIGLLNIISDSSVPFMPVLNFAF